MKKKMSDLLELGTQPAAHAGGDCDLEMKRKKVLLQYPGDEGDELHVLRNKRRIGSFPGLAEAAAHLMSHRPVKSSPAHMTGHVRFTKMEMSRVIQLEDCTHLMLVG